MRRCRNAALHAPLSGHSALCRQMAAAGGPRSLGQCRPMSARRRPSRKSSTPAAVRPASGSNCSASAAAGPASAAVVAQSGRQAAGKRLVGSLKDPPASLRVAPSSRHRRLATGAATPAQQWQRKQSLASNHEQALPCWLRRQTWRHSWKLLLQQIQAQRPPPSRCWPIMNG